MTTALILAGGLGKRLRPITYKIPKPMIRVGGRPILYWQLELLKRHYVDRVILLVGYKAGAIVDAVGDGSAFGLSVEYSVEDEPLGTAGAVKRALKLVEDEYFFVLNGDIITDLNISKLAVKMEKTKAPVVMAAVPLVSPYGVLVTSDDHVVDFKEKPAFSDVWINAGVYIMRKEVDAYLPVRGSLEEQVFPVLAKEGKLAVEKYSNVFWKSIDSHKDIEEADKALRGGRLQY